MAKTLKYDAAEYLDTKEAIAAYLSEAFQTGDNDLIKIAIGTVARAKGMGDIAKHSGLNRENLYRSFSEAGQPEFGTVMKVLNSLDMQLIAVPKQAA
jgi:probable addiction module antidote protein